MPEENPYAPPLATTDEIPVAPPPFGWAIEDTVVWVRGTSRFPMVDPFTGRSADSMMLQRVRIRHRPLWLWTLPAVGALAGIVLFPDRGTPNDLATSGVAGLVLGWLCALLLGAFRPVCTLHLFFEKRTLRFRRVVSGILNGLFLTGFLGGIAQAALPLWLGSLCGLAFGCWLIGAFATLLLYRRLRCRRMAGARFAIRGFHPQALKALTDEVRSCGRCPPRSAPPWVR